MLTSMLGHDGTYSELGEDFRSGFRNGTITSHFPTSNNWVYCGNSPYLVKDALPIISQGLVNELLADLQTAVVLSTNGCLAIWRGLHNYKAAKHMRQSMPILSQRRALCNCPQLKRVNILTSDGGVLMSSR